MNKKFILRGWRNWLCGMAALALAACNVEEEFPSSQTTLKEGEVALQWIPANMGRVVSKGTDVKTGDERKITNVHIFLFDSKGEYLTPANEGRDAFQGYRELTDGNSSWILQTELFEDQTENGAKNAIVYALANLPEGTFTDENKDQRPDELEVEGKTPLQALEELIVAFPEGTFIAQLPDVGLPMAIKKEGVDLSTTANETLVPLQLRSMMARIDLNFTMDPLEEDGNLPSLEFTKVSVGNFPEGGKVVSQLVDWTGASLGDNIETADGEGEDVALTSIEVKNASLVGKTLRAGYPQNLTLYMFEHSRLSANPDFNYPMDEDDANDYNKQRYKNELAKDDAAYIELEGTYTSQNNFSYRVRYRLYVGANPIDDFTIKPNCQYVNNILVTGITVNQYGDEALLDTRVTIDENTPAFIEILRERMHDAHFNVTPMDVYFNNKNASVTIEILNENGNDLASENEMSWIRMESYNQAYGASNGNLYDFGDNGKNASNQYAARFAGDGKRKYFTINLLNELENTYHEGSRRITMNAGDGREEQRVYFYIDENVPESGNLPERVPSRTATVRITYAENGETVSSKTAIITQAGMRRVYFDKYDRNYGADYEPYYFYIEEYEEYLAHYDPKNEYTHTYEGLEWGLSGLMSGLGAENKFYDYLSWGWYNTAKIMAEFREWNAWRGHEMTLNELPSGAAEYCYNKNKREDEDGNLTDENVRWFLPTTSELEYALEAHYGNYDVFQDKWYWSSNPGATWNPIDGGDVGEDERYARATRIKADPNNESGEAENGYVHYRSNPDYIYVPDGSEPYPETKGIGGYAERSVKFRIRAAYIPESQVPSDRELQNRYNRDGSVN